MSLPEGCAQCKKVFTRVRFSYAWEKGLEMSRSNIYSIQMHKGFETETIKAQKETLVSRSSVNYMKCGHLLLSIIKDSYLNHH